MNPRIRELMIQAGYVAPELAGRAHKLAELISQHIISIVAMYGVHNYDNEDVAGVCERIVGEIKETFGTQND